MAAWQAVTARDRATDSATRAEGELREARERARRANESLRRALRQVEEAEGAFHQATRHLYRIEFSLAEVR